MIDQPHANGASGGSNIYNLTDIKGGADAAKAGILWAEEHDVPVVLPGLLATWPAVLRWAGPEGLEGLAVLAGRADVQVMVSHSHVFYGDIARHQPASMSFSQLVQLLQTLERTGPCRGLADVQKGARGAGAGGAAACGTDASGAGRDTGGAGTSGAAMVKAMARPRAQLGAVGTSGTSGADGRKKEGAVTCAGDAPAGRRSDRGASCAESEGSSAGSSGEGEDEGDEDGDGQREDDSGITSESTEAGSDSSSGASVGGLHVYLAQQPLSGGLAPLLADAPLPRCLEGKQLASTNLWMCGGPVRSSMHYDPHHNLLALVRGAKRVTLIPPHLTPCVYPMSVAGDAPNHSRVPFAEPRPAARHPAYAAALAAAQHVELKAGDALFVPEGWWHQVDSGPETTIAVNYWWRSALAEALRPRPYAPPSGPPTLLLSPPPGTAGSAAAATNAGGAAPAAAATGADAAAGAAQAAAAQSAPATARGAATEAGDDGVAAARDAPPSPGGPSAIPRAPGAAPDAAAARQPAVVAAATAAAAAAPWGFTPAPPAPPAPPPPGPGLRSLFALRQLTRAAIDDVAEQLLAAVQAAPLPPVALAAAAAAAATAAQAAPPAAQATQMPTVPPASQAAEGQRSGAAGPGACPSDTAEARDSGGGGEAAEAASVRAAAAALADAIRRDCDAVDAGGGAARCGRQELADSAGRAPKLPVQETAATAATAATLPTAADADAHAAAAAAAGQGNASGPPPPPPPRLRRLPPHTLGLLLLLPEREAAALALGDASAVAGVLAALPPGRLAAALYGMCDSDPGSVAALLTRCCRVPSVACLLTRAWDRLEAEEGTGNTETHRHERELDEPGSRQDQEKVAAQSSVQRGVGAGPRGERAAQVAASEVGEGEGRGGGVGGDAEGQGDKQRPPKRQRVAGAGSCPAQRHADEAVEGPSGTEVAGGCVVAGGARRSAAAAAGGTAAAAAEAAAGAAGAAMAAASGAPGAVTTSAAAAASEAACGVSKAGKHTGAVAPYPSLAAFFQRLYGTVDDPDQVFRLLLSGREALNAAARKLLVENVLA